jgi:hypothetical protein
MCDAARRLLSLHQWNRLVVTCIGSHLQIELNGTQIIENQLDQGLLSNRPLESYIGFQDHGEPNNDLFRNIRIRTLSQ